MKTVLNKYFGRGGEGGVVLQQSFSKQILHRLFFISAGNFGSTTGNKSRNIKWNTSCEAFARVLSTYAQDQIFRIFNDNWLQVRMTV